MVFGNQKVRRSAHSFVNRLNGYSIITPLSHKNLPRTFTLTKWSPLMFWRPISVRLTKSYA